MVELQMNQTCFFTGHRILPTAKLDRIKALTEQYVIDKYNEGITDFISGGAKGFDTVAAQIVIRLKNTPEFKNMRLLLYIPCYDFGEKWKYSDRCNLNFLKYNADVMEIVTKELYSIECMKKRNEKMVTDSGCGIAYMTTTYSGTGQTVNTAKRQEKSVINLADII